MADPYRRGPRTLDYGAVASHQIKVISLRARVEARRQQRGTTWQPEPGPLLRRRQRIAEAVAALVFWLLVYLILFGLVVLLGRWWIGIFP